MDISGSIRIIAHPEKPDAALFAKGLMRWLVGEMKQNCQILSCMQDIKKGSGLLIPLGGDGFFMRVAEELVRKNLTTPLLGINLGDVGFLTLAETNTYKEVICAALRGELEFEKRFALRIGVNGETFIGVNDVYVRPRIGTLVAKVEINDTVFFTQIKSDTLIVYTPMGSTGYNASASGPIIMPTVECFGLTSLAAMALNARVPIIMNAGAKIRITVLGVRAEVKEPLPLQIDGHICLDGLPDGAVVEIDCFASSVKYLGDGWRSFAYALHHKAGLMG